MKCAIFFITLGGVTSLLCILRAFTLPWVETGTTISRGSYRVAVQLRMGLTRDFSDVCIVSDRAAANHHRVRGYLRKITPLHRQESAAESGEEQVLLRSVPLSDAAAAPTSEPRTPCITKSEYESIQQPFLRAGFATLYLLRASALCCLLSVLMATFGSLSFGVLLGSWTLYMLLTSCTLQFAAVSAYVFALRHHAAVEGFLAGIWLILYSIVISFLCTVWADTAIKIFDAAQQQRQQQQQQRSSLVLLTRPYPAPLPTTDATAAGGELQQHRPQLHKPQLSQLPQHQALAESDALLQRNDAREYSAIDEHPQIRSYDSIQ